MARPAIASRRAIPSHFSEQPEDEAKCPKAAYVRWPMECIAPSATLSKRLCHPVLYSFIPIC